MNSQLNAMLPASRKVWAEIIWAVGFGARFGVRFFWRFIVYVPVAVFWLIAFAGIYGSDFDQSPITVEMLFSSFKEAWFRVTVIIALVAAATRTILDPALSRYSAAETE